MDSIYGYGHIIRILGESGDIKVEGDIILLEHNVETWEFSR